MLFNFALLNPKGMIALHERDLMLMVVSLALLIIIPVLVFGYYTAWKYRAGNKHAKYAPDEKRKISVMLLWWAVPAIIILCISLINWQTTHDLDPSIAIQSHVKPITVEVVALNWKWLFIYPEQGIATVNFLEIPENTPINFKLTADAPMNSFWIPQLGGQMYAMPGMSTQLHLIAGTTGDFAGSAAEVNGKGFSGMKFVTRSASRTDFDAWVDSVRQSQNVLTYGVYEKLAEPSENNPVSLYSIVDPNLYNEVIEKFMAPSH